MFRRVVYLTSSDFDLVLANRNLKNIMTFDTTSKSRYSSLAVDHCTTYQSVPDFYAGKSVFITGGTGFLGKIFIERLLFNCSEIDKVYVLIRDKKGVSPKERIREITTNSLFTKLKKIRPIDLEKIIPIEGDISSNNLGMKPEDQYTILEKVSVVFHSAAEVRFNRPLKQILKVNVEGTREILQLCRRMNKIEAFVYVSTAYSNAEKSTIDEVVYPAPDKLCEAYKFLERENDPKEIIKFLKGKLNSYTYSKAMAENFVEEEHGHVPSIIVRPSIVGPIKNEPLPGWLDNWNGATQLLFDLGTGLNNIFHGTRENVLDVIPADYTVNLAVVAATRCGSSGNEVKVYNSCTSLDSPLTCGYLWDKCAQEIRKLNEDKSKSKVYCIKSAWMVSLMSLVLQTLPAYFADCWLRLRGKDTRHVKELTPAIALRDFLKYFTSHSMSWKTNNTRSLHASLSRRDQQLFPCDPADVSWDKYLEDYCAGIYKYLLVKKNV